MITKERFYTLLKSKLGYTSINDKTIIPNTKKLHNIFINNLGVDCDETIGERTAESLYQIYKENR